MADAVLATLLFSSIVLTLVLLILGARRVFLPSGVAFVQVNERQKVEGRLGEKLLEALAAAGIDLPSACGGKGTCGQCRVRVEGSPPPALPTEAARLSAPDLAHGHRLACQLTLRTDLSIWIPDEIFGVQEWQCGIRSARYLNALVREIIAEIPEGERIDFRAGSFVQVTVPPFEADFRSFPIDERLRSEWDRLGLWDHEVASVGPVTRAYSLANPPQENRVIHLLVRLATPPASAPPGTPPGIASSYLFRAPVNTTLQIAGPYGHFFADDSEREMVFVGGGVGMAPLRSHILDQLLRLRSGRKISFWYGARNRRELMYAEEFEKLARTHPNFGWHPALSEPAAGDDWTGEVGFIHDVLEEAYLVDHPAPADCEFYLCGPPLMARATIAMLERLGVLPDRIHFDDFGG